MATVIAKVKVETTTRKKATVSIEIPDYVTNDETVNALVQDYLENADTTDIMWAEEETDDDDFEVEDWEFGGADKPA